MAKVTERTVQATDSGREPTERTDQIAGYYRQKRELDLFRAKSPSALYEGYLNT